MAEKKYPAFDETGTMNPDYLQSMQEQAYKNYAGLMVDPTGAQAQQYMQQSLGAINREQQEMQGYLKRAELDAYKALGQQQLQLENSIAEQRMKALRSGTTSAQLASQELASIFASQQGAQQVAANMQTQGLDTAQQYAQQRGQIIPNLYNMTQTNQQTLATAGAQNYAASSSAFSYLNQHLANLMANKGFIDKYGKKALKNTMNP